MRRVRMKIVAAVLLVALILAVGLAGCAGGLPSVLEAPGRLTDALSNVAQEVATAQAAQAENQAEVQAQPLSTVGDLQAALQNVYQRVNPSVVNIRVTTQVISGLEQLLPDMQLPFPFGQDAPNQDSPRQQAPQATSEGSGFVWDRQGHIVTNNHVVEGATSIIVTFSDGTSVPAELVGADPDSDLAVIKVDAESVTVDPVTVADSTHVLPGQLVVAIGNPFGLEGSMTFGIVSAVGRSMDAGSGSSSQSGDTATYTIPDIIQTDAPVNPGNSGGVLLDLNGQLIGVPTAIESAVRSSAGVGLAVPSVIVSRVVPQLIEKGVYQHPYIGIQGGTLTSQVAEAMGLDKSQRGALVISVTKGSPADKAGLRASAKQVTIDGEDVKVGGDVITAIDGRPVQDFEDLTAYLAQAGEVGKTVELTILRDGETTRLPLTLGARPGSGQAAQSGGQDESRPQPQAAWLGISGIDLNAELAQEMNLEANQRGALIQNVTAGSPADEAGLRGSYKDYQTRDGRQVMVGGDVIVALDGQKVESVRQLSTLIGRQRAGDQVTLTVLRDGSEVQVEVTLAARPASSD